MPMARTRRGRLRQIERWLNDKFPASRPTIVRVRDFSRSRSLFGGTTWGETTRVKDKIYITLHSKLPGYLANDTLLHEWAGGPPAGRTVQAVTMAGLSGGFLAGEGLEVTLDEHGDEVRPLRLRLGEGIAGTAALKRRPVNVPDVRRDERWQREADIRSGFETRSILAVPMLRRGRLVGVIEVLNHRSGRLPDSIPIGIRHTAILGDTAIMLHPADVGAEIITGPSIMICIQRHRDSVCSH